MRVHELIAQLTMMDQDLEVVMPADDSMGFCEVQVALIDTVVVLNGSMSLADERDQGHTHVVRLFGPESDFEAFPLLDD